MPANPSWTRPRWLPDKAGDLDGRKLALSETVGSLTAKGVSFESPLPRGRAGAPDCRRRDGRRSLARRLQ